ncbi:DUF6415 family natural product biosynthesis protein [Streptomyces sp. IBSBF 2507]|uniref:DUF6415 family natural product biosynthesis protein n=1 Tax=Streptomyces sp. IBSBF 2507 TaxID=2903530 RepID=UPI00351EC9D7
MDGRFVRLPRKGDGGVMRTTQQHIDADQVSHLIAEALGATGILPPMTRLEELDRALRAEIERLVLLVQRRADAKPQGSRDWYRLVQAAERAEDSLNFQMGTAPLAGAIHVAHLARHVHELREVEVIG